MSNNHKRKFSDYNIIIENDEDLIKTQETDKENNNKTHNESNNKITKLKKCKIEYLNKNINYLEEEDNCDLNNAIVVTNNNFVDYLLFELNHNL